MSLPTTIDPLPSTFTFGKVVGRIIHAIADTDEDLDDKPQARPAAGKVNFAPKRTLSRTTTPDADFSAFVLQGRESANLSSSGRILDAEGRQGIWLISGIWNVSFDLVGGAQIPPFDIEVLPIHTESAPLDLAAAAPFVAPPGSIIQTVQIPSGGVDGRVLTYSGGTAVWALPALPSGYVQSETISHIVRVTEAEYAALPSPDSSTLYVIV